MLKRKRAVLCAVTLLAAGTACAAPVPEVQFPACYTDAMDTTYLTQADIAFAAEVADRLGVAGSTWTIKFAQEICRDLRANHPDFVGRCVKFAWGAYSGDADAMHAILDDPSAGIPAELSDWFHRFLTLMSEGWQWYFSDYGAQVGIVCAGHP